MSNNLLERGPVLIRVVVDFGAVGELDAKELGCVEPVQELDVPVLGLPEPHRAVLVPGTTKGRAEDANERMND